MRCFLGCPLENVRKRRVVVTDNRKRPRLCVFLNSFYAACAFAVEMSHDKIKIRFSFLWSVTCVSETLQTLAYKIRYFVAYNAP